MKRRSADAEQSGWAASKDLRWVRCPDCEIREALHADGHVLRHPQGGFRLSVGCETCDGRGAVASSDRLDPYVTGK